MKTMKKSNLKKMTATLLLFAILFLGGATACDDSTSRQGDNSPSIVVNSNQAPQTAAANPQCPPSVSRVVWLQDKSDSTNQTRTPQTSMVQIDMLIDFIRPCGGELAWGLINEQSNSSLHRLRIDVPPSGAPIEPDRNGNPFNVQRELAAYRRDKARYDETVRTWREESERRIADFKEQISELLGNPANARATDIFGGIQRASLFLSESDATWSVPTRKILIVVSDGIDNMRRSYTRLGENTKFILVNGSASVGSLSTLNPTRFESIESAIRFVIAAEGQIASSRGAP